MNICIQKPIPKKCPGSQKYRIEIRTPDTLWQLWKVLRQAEKGWTEKYIISFVEGFWEMALEKAVRKTILPCETKRHAEKSFSSLLLDRFNPGIKTIQEKGRGGSMKCEVWPCWWVTTNLPMGVTTYVCTTKGNRDRTQKCTQIWIWSLKIKTDDRRCKWEELWSRN